MSESLKEKTAKGLFWGGFSNGIQQLLNLFFGIFLARLLNADDYGMVGMLTIFIAVAGTLQESGFTNALTNKREVTHKDYNAVFWFSTLTGITMYILLFLSAPLIADFYDKPELVPLARYLFIGFLISSSATAHNAVLFKNLMVKQKAMSQIIALTLSGIIGVIMAFNGMTYWGIATQSVVYILVVTICFWHFSPWRPTLNIDFRPLKSMFGFSSKILVTNIFTQINNNIFSVLLGKFFSEAEVGYYTQANKWNTMGHSLITGMVSGVAQPVLTEVANDAGRQRNVFRKMLRFTAFISFPAMFGLALIAHELIVISVTDKWLDSVPILQLLCIWGAFLPILSLYSNLIISKGKSDIYMWNTIALGILQVIVILLAYPYGIHTMIVAFVTVNIVWMLVWHYFVWQQIRLSLWNALKEGKQVLLEGQLGTLKDPDHGIYPMVTSSSTLAAYGAIGAGIPPYEIKKIVTVCKAYSSAVGAGAFVSEIFGDEADELRRRGGDGGEFGATTGRPRRMGWFDCVASKYGCRMQGTTDVAFTVLDVLGYLDEIPVCVGYDIDGEVTTDFPTTHLLEKAKPVLKTLPGWKCDIRGIKKYEDLPENCRNYIEFIEEQIGYPITMVSNGPERHDIIHRESELSK